jgi:hypothetical protein
MPIWIDQELVPWIDTEGHLVPATGSAVDKAPGAPPGPPPSGDGDGGGGGGGGPAPSKPQPKAQKHPAQPKATHAAPGPLAAYRTTLAKPAAKADPTGALKSLSHPGVGITKPATGASTPVRPKTQANSTRMLQSQNSRGVSTPRLRAAAAFHDRAPVPSGAVPRAATSPADAHHHGEPAPHLAAAGTRRGFWGDLKETWHMHEDVKGVMEKTDLARMARDIGEVRSDVAARATGLRSQVLTRASSFRADWGGIGRPTDEEWGIGAGVGGGGKEETD